MKKRMMDDRSLAFALSVEEDSKDSYCLQLQNNKGIVGHARYDHNPLDRKVIQVDINITGDYRYHTLGTQLLRLLVQHARDRHVLKLYGSIVQKDIDETPGLVEWYESMGFQRCNPYPGRIPNAVVHIVMDLTE